VGIRLSQDEAWDVLAQSRTGILTTLKLDGAPITLPVWFAALERTICFITPVHTKKVARLRRDPRASFLVESGARWSELRGVHLTGVVEEVHDDADKARIDSAVSEKYRDLMTRASRLPAATRDYYAARVFFRLVPAERMLTWDNSRIEVASDG
jgi:PPOX class probable F420-dependent enzyme